MSSPARSAVAIAAFVPGSLATPSAPTLTSAINFLSCLSKTAIERVGSSLNVLPRQRVMETRAAVVTEAAGSTYIHPAALFALSPAQIARHSEALRDYSWGYGDTDDASDETTEQADGAPGAEDDSLGPEPDDLDYLSRDSLVGQRNAAALGV
jgi:ParB family chromosome partitioning protein